MGEPILFPTLVGKMAERGITTRQIAQAAGISNRAIYNKMRGIAPFTWPEVCAIRRKHFPDLSSDELFRMS